MARYFIHFAYDGTGYAGWQRQPNAITVQQRLDDALSLLLRESVETVGAGRTDAGVHARHMVAHFDFGSIDNLDQLCFRINGVLPPDISVQRIEKVSDDLHARFSAKQRVYHYYLHQSRDPFLRHYSLESHFALDFKLMNEAAAHLLTVTDFAAFAKVHTDVKTTICHVTEAQWIQIDCNKWLFRISADRFLRNMVRAIVGTLLNVGRGKTSLSEFVQIVAEGDRCQAGDSAPAHALFLEDVIY